jgi:DNA-binding GntR family transcriptional regulator
MTIGSPGRGKEVAVEMEKILSALSQRDALAAQKAAVEHVQRVSEIAIKILKE